MLASWLTHLGFTRDDAIWLWGRVVGAAAVIGSGVFDLNYWANQLGFQVSPKVEHGITVIAVIILWISGKQATSHLPGETK